MVNQKELSTYLRQVKKAFPKAQKKKFTEELQSNISDYLEVNPNATMHDIQKHFGSPDKFSDEYWFMMDEKSRKNAISCTKQIRRWVLIIIIAALLIIVGVAVWIITKNQQTLPTYYYQQTLISYT